MHPGIYFQSLMRIYGYRRLRKAAIPMSSRSRPVKADAAASGQPSDTAVWYRAAAFAPSAAEYDTWEVLPPS